MVLKVNQRLVPISHKLKNGDQVEILYFHKQEQKEDLGVDWSSPLG